MRLYAQHGTEIAEFVTLSARILNNVVFSLKFFSTMTQVTKC
jgi:hypothetical protein